MTDKREKAREEREAVYQTVRLAVAAVTNKTLTLDEARERLENINEIAKTFYCIYMWREKVKEIDTTKELYNRVAFAYLRTFDGVGEEIVLRRENIYDMRAKFSTIQRCIRHIKADMPELFHDDLIKTAKADDEEAADSFGNSVVGIEGEAE